MGGIESFQNNECTNVDQSVKNTPKDILEDLRNKDRRIKKQSEEIVILKNEEFGYNQKDYIIN